MELERHSLSLERSSAFTDVKSASENTHWSSPLGRGIPAKPPPACCFQLRFRQLPAGVKAYDLGQALIDRWQIDRGASTCSYEGEISHTFLLVLVMGKGLFSGVWSHVVCFLTMELC